MLAARALMLQRIGDALQESIKFKSTGIRLGRNLRSERFKDDLLDQNYLGLVAPLLRGEVRDQAPKVIVVDGSDVQKPYCRTDKHPRRRRRGMKYVATVRDGSRKRVERLPNGKNTTKAAFGPGYELLNVHADFGARRHLPLHTRLWSGADPTHRSPLRYLQDAVAAVHPHCDADTPWVFDRGYDDIKVYDYLNEQGVRFVTRLNTSKRVLFVQGTKHEVREVIADQIDLAKHTTRWRKFERGGKLASLPAGLDFIEDVRLLEHPPGHKARGCEGKTQYSLVAFQAKGQDPVVVLTNRPVTTFAEADEVAQAYMRRWIIEEDFRALKEEFNFENHLRLLNWKGLCRLVKLAMLAFAFPTFVALTLPELARRMAAAVGRISAKWTYGRVLEAVHRVFAWRGLERFLHKCGP